MPELPEVEMTRRHLHDALVGKRVSAVVVKRERMIRRQPVPADFVPRLEGKRVIAVGRRGKTITAKLSSGMFWLSHLGMSGRMQLASAAEAMPPHANVVVDFAKGPQLRFVDPRTFGYMVVLTADELEVSSFARLGPDALDALPRSPALARRLGGRSAPIKALLLDQTLLSGLGNIYADEVLHRSRIRGDRPAGSLTMDEVKALRRAIRPVLEAGLRHGGTSLDDMAYLLPDGRAGGYVERLAVYGREDEPCPRCGELIERTVLRGRSTYWCRGCQR